MVEKFSIAKTQIDLTKLSSKIDEFRLIKNESPYIFMNTDTLDELLNIVGFNSDGLMGSQDEFLCGKFRGSKVFGGNTLKYGEIELR